MEPKQRDTAKANTLFVVVHGLLGNYLSGVPRRAAFELARAGYTALSVNTRLANYGVVYGGGLLHEATHDLDGAFELARSRDFKQIVLLGYGTGASLAVYFAGHEKPPELKGVVALGLREQLATATRERWDRNGAVPSFEQTLAAATEFVGSHDSHEDEIFVVEQAFGPTKSAGDAEIWTYRTWLAVNGAQAPVADAKFGVSHLTVPLLVVQPDDQEAAPPAEAERIAAAASDAAQVEVATVSDSGYAFWDRVPQAVEVLSEWTERKVEHQEGGTSSAPSAQPTSELVHRLVTITAADGLPHDALLHIDEAALARRAKATGKHTAIVHIHGNQGNFTVGTLRFMPPTLAQNGWPMLVLETRIGNVSQLFGSSMFEEALLDVAAGFDWLLANGFDDVIVCGYSLGASLAIRFAAERKPPELRGLLTLGASWSLPESTQARMLDHGAAPSYDDVVALAQPASEDAELTDQIVVIRGVYGPSSSTHHAGVYTDRTWWHSRGPSANDAMAKLHIADVKAPMLLVQGTTDVIVDPDEAVALVEQAQSGGNTDCELLSIEGAGHSFAHHEAEVTAGVLDWLERLT